MIKPDWSRAVCLDCIDETGEGILFEGLSGSGYRRAKAHAEKYGHTVTYTEDKVIRPTKAKAIEQGGRHD